MRWYSPVAGEYHILVDPSVTLIINGCRRTPLAGTDQLKNTVEDQLQAGVIAKVTEPTWA